jgi:hypothetical protein
MFVKSANAILIATLAASLNLAALATASHNSHESDQLSTFGSDAGIDVTHMKECILVIVSSVDSMLSEFRLVEFYILAAKYIAEH